MTVSSLLTTKFFLKEKESLAKYSKLYSANFQERENIIKKNFEIPF